MAAQDHTGLYLPFTMRMNKVARQIIIGSFVRTGEHCSPTGTTARLVVNHCLTNNITFTVEHHVKPDKYYVVRLLRKKVAFKITYRDPVLGKDVVIWKDFYDGGPGFTAKEAAEDWAYTAADKGPYKVEEA